MEVERLEKVKKTAHIHLAMEAKGILKRIEEDFPDNPEAMGYFYDLFRRVYCDGAPVNNSKKMIGTMCIQVPEELIYASDAFPVRLCSGAYAFEQTGAEFMPARCCSLVKATIGMLKSFPYHDSLSLVVNPTTCDQKKKAGEMLVEMGYEVYHLEVPPTKDTEEARLYWQRSVKKFALTLEDVTGHRITKSRVKKAIRKISRARAEYRRLYNLMKCSTPLIRGNNAFLVTNAYFFDDIERWTDALEKLNNELEERKRDGFFAAQRHSSRILLTGSPPIFPNFKLLLLVEQTGGIIVADEVCSSSRLLYDTVGFDEANMYDMIPAIADRYLKPCICPSFTPNIDRERRLLNNVREFSADGVIYQSFAGCQLYEMESRHMGKMLEKNGIPMLYIETDYSPDETGQLSTRIEAFIELLQDRKTQG